MTTRQTYLTLWLSLAAFCFPFAEPAFAQSVIINTELTAMPLSGTGLMPFGTGDPTVNQGYQYVESSVTASLSSIPNAKSTGTTSLDVAYFLADPTDLNTFSITVQTASTFSFFLDLTFTDVDPVFDYAVGLGSTFTLLADPNQPLVINLTDSVTFLLADILANPDVLPDDPGIITASSKVSRELGVDVNASGQNDFIKYIAAGFEFGDDLTFDDTVLTSMDVDSIVDAILLGGLGSPFVIDAQIAISSATFTFAGDVADDATDPPFRILLVGPEALSVPEPGTLALLGLVLVGVGLSRRKLHGVVR